MSPIDPIDMKNPPTVLDIEASGFGSGSYPIEVGYIRGDGSSWCTLIRPEPQWTHWDSGAEQVHGIKRDLLFEHGREINEVAQRINHDLRGITVFTDAWYHDYVWLSRLFDSAGCHPAFPLKDLRTLLAEDDLARWDTTRSEIAAALALPRHRASNDARVLQATVVRLKSPA